MKITDHIIVLDHANAGPPVFDVEVGRLNPQYPAPCRMVYGKVRPPTVVGSKAKLVTCLQFSVDPDLPKERRRFAVLVPGGTIDAELAPHALYVGGYLHPVNGMPLSVYEFDVAATDAFLAAEADAPTDVEGPDVLAAIAATRAAQEAAND